MIPKIKTYNSKYVNPKFSFVAIIVLTGSVFEADDEKGISHFIEHLLFKGSKYESSIKNLNNKLNSKGMIVNAFTSNFVTVYHLSCPTSDVKEAIDTLVKMVFNPLFREADINSERKIVINELNERYSSPEGQAYIDSLKKIYNHKNPLNHPVIGYEKVLKNIDQENILTYYHKFYQPKNIIFFADTSKSKESIKKDWQDSFQKYGNNNNNEFPPTLDMYKKLKPQLCLTNPSGKFHFKNPNPHSTYILIIYNIPNVTPKQEAAFDIFSNILSGGLSSIFFTKLRDEKQLTYGAHSEVIPSVESIQLSINLYCPKNNKKIKDCITTINNIINDCIKNGVNPHEFNKFKNKTIINYHRISENGNVKLNELIDKYLFGLPKTNYQKNLKAITNSYLHDTLQNKLKNKNTKKYIFFV